MLGHRIDGETELRLIEPRDAEALNDLIERNKAHIREWSAWLKEERSVENTRAFIRRNLARMVEDDGYARALIEYAFGELGLNRVEIRCASENRRSRGIPERLGFRQEGVLSQAEWMHDHFHDLVVYAVLADDWRAS